MGLNEKFHAIEGETVGERRKNLNQLLRNLHKADDVNALEPGNHLEELFKVDALISLKNDEALLNVLQGDHCILIHKVLKQGFAIVKPRILTLDAEQFVHDLLPSLAIITKIKLLNKLAGSDIATAKADEWFAAVKNEYGLHLALKLLPCCSAQVILNAVKLPRFYLDSTQLLSIIKRQPAITSDLINALVERKQGRFPIHDSILKHIINVNVDLYLELTAKHNFTIKLSKRETKRFIQSQTQAVVSDLTKYKAMLHFAQAQKMLKTDFQYYYIDSLREFANDSSVNTIAFHLGNIRVKRYRWPFFVNCFQQQYGFNVLDDPNLITITVLKLMDKNVRLDYVAKAPRPPAIPEDVWMSCHSARESIPFFKRKIKLTSSVRDRTILLDYLVETCFVNDDEQALAQVCDYFLKAHKNETCSTRQAFLSSIEKRYKMEKLTPAVWTLILQIIELFLVRDEQAWLSQYAVSYMKHLIRRGQSLDAGLTLFGRCSDSSWRTLAADAIYGRTMIEAVIQRVPNTAYKTPALFARDMERSIGTVTLWNEKHPNRKISLLQNAAYVQYLQQEFATNKGDSVYNKYEDVLKLLKQEELTSVSLEIIDLLFTPSNISELSLIDYAWLLKRRPSIVKANMALILPRMFTGTWSGRNYTAWKCFRSFAHLQLPHAINAYIRNNLQEDDVLIGNCMKAAALMMPDEQFHALASLYAPETGATIEDVERSVFQGQQALAQALVHVRAPYTITDIILKYFSKEYMPTILKSFRATAWKLKERQLDVLLMPLEKEQAVSLNKHTIYLYNHLKNLSTSREYLQKAVAREKNLSIRKVLARTLFNNFSANGDRFTWDLLRKIFQGVDAKDVEALRDIIRIERVPDEYLLEYIQFAWGHLQKFALAEEKMNEMRSKFCNSLTSKIIPQLSTDFLLTILRQHLFKTHKTDWFQEVLQDFACRCLCSTTGQNREKIFQEIVTLTQSYVTKYWNTAEINYCSATLHNFITLFEQCNKEMFERLKNAFTQMLNPIEAFNEYLLLEFGLISYSETVEEIVEKLVPVINNVNVALCYPMFYNALRRYFEKYAAKGPSKRENENKFHFVHQLVTACSSVNCVIIACLMMDREKPSTPRAKILHEEIVSVFKSSQSDVVKTYLHNHMKQIFY